MCKLVELVVLDWAGTTVDFGSCAPTDVFSRVFQSKGIHFTREQINRPMGIEKRKHIRELLMSAPGRDKWRKLYGREWNKTDIDELYQLFEEELLAVVQEYSVPIEGVVDTVKILRDKGIKIGSTTGYSLQVMEEVKVRAAQFGFKPDAIITPDNVGAGRPTPYMLFECMKELAVYPPSSVVKVGDTLVDIQEGTNAGAWSVGILTGSNLLGLTKEETVHISEDELTSKKEKVRQAYFEAGAHFVIDTIHELPEVIQKINNKNRGIQ